MLPQLHEEEFRISGVPFLSVFSAACSVFEQEFLGGVLALARSS